MTKSLTISSDHLLKNEMAHDTSIVVRHKNAKLPVISSNVGTSLTSNIDLIYDVNGEVILVTVAPTSSVVAAVAVVTVVVSSPLSPLLLRLSLVGILVVTPAAL